MKTVLGVHKVNLDSQGQKATAVSFPFQSLQRLIRAATFSNTEKRLIRNVKNKYNVIQQPLSTLSISTELKFSYFTHFKSFSFKEYFPKQQF